MVARDASFLTLASLAPGGAGRPDKIISHGRSDTVWSGATPTILANRTGALVAAAGERPINVSLDTRPLSCQEGICPFGFTCVPSATGESPDGVCVCALPPCEAKGFGEPQPSEVEGPSLPLAATAKTIPIRTSSNVSKLFVHGFDDDRIHDGLLDPAFGTVLEARGLEARSSPSLSALDDVRVLVTGGRTVDGTALSSSIEALDASTLEVTRLGDLAFPVVEHAAAPFHEATLLVGGCLDPACDTLATSMQVILRDAPLVVRRGPRLPVPRVNPVAMPLPSSDVLVTAGGDRSTFIFERVPRGFRPARDEAEDRCTVSETLEPVVGDEEGLVVEGTTDGEHDRLRTAVCAFPEASEHPELVYSAPTASGCGPPAPERADAHAAELTFSDDDDGRDRARGGDRLGHRHHRRHPPSRRRAGAAPGRRRAAVGSSRRPPALRPSKARSRRAARPQRGGGACTAGAPP